MTIVGGLSRVRRALVLGVFGAVAAAVFGCPEPRRPEDPAARNLAVVRRYFEAGWSGGDSSAVYETVADDLQATLLREWGETEVSLMGPGVLHRVIREMHSRFGAGIMKVERIVADSSGVAVRWALSGEGLNLRGDWWGELREGRIVSTWEPAPGLGPDLSPVGPADLELEWPKPPTHARAPDTILVTTGAGPKRSARPAWKVRNLDEETVEVEMWSMKSAFGGNLWIYLRGIWIEYPERELSASAIVTCHGGEEEVFGHAPVGDLTGVSCGRWSYGVEVVDILEGRVVYRVSRSKH